MRDPCTLGAEERGGGNIVTGKNLPYAALQPETYDPHSKGSNAAAEGQARFAQCSPNRRLDPGIREFTPGFSFWK
jgi:hypothetical protein